MCKGMLLSYNGFLFGGMVEKRKEIMLQPTYVCDYLYGCDDGRSDEFVVRLKLLVFVDHINGDKKIELSKELCAVHTVFLLALQYIIHNTIT